MVSYYLKPRVHVYTLSKDRQDARFSSCFGANLTFLQFNDLIILILIESNPKSKRMILRLIVNLISFLIENEIEFDSNFYHQ